MGYLLSLLILSAPADAGDSNAPAPIPAGVVRMAYLYQAPAAPDDAPLPGETPAAGDAAKAPASPGEQPPAEGESAEEKPPLEEAKQDAEPGEGEADDAEDAEAEVSPFWGAVNDMMKSGALGLLLEGGFFMWPILLMAIVAAGVIIERYRSLKMLSTDTTGLRQEVSTLLQADKVEDALKLCDAQQGPVAAVLSTGLRKFFVLRRLDYDAGRIEEQVIKSMDDYSVHIVAALERHLPILATISSVAPMLGFLGTVQGMIVSFKDIVMKMGEVNIVEAAAGGIQVSLLTTCFGLIVGIPAFMAFNYFNSVINRSVLDVEESATELIETVTLKMAMER